MIREDKQIRSLATDLNVRSEFETDNPDEMVIEGYFALVNNETELFKGAYEEIATGAFDKTLDNDIRALHNHDSNYVLGRTKSKTLSLKVDERGLWGSVKVNENDSDAVNLYERIKRGDVDQCSFGFNILDEETEDREDETVKWIIKEIDLHEVSVVTFPAYEDTGIEARKQDYKQHQSKQLELRKQKLKERLNKC